MFVLGRNRENIVTYPEYTSLSTEMPLLNSPWTLVEGIERGSEPGPFVDHLILLPARVQHSISVTSY